MSHFFKKRSSNNNNGIQSPEEKKYDSNSNTNESIKHINTKRERSLAKEFLRLALENESIGWTNVKTSDPDIRIQYATIRRSNICTVRSSITVNFTCDKFYEFVNAYSDGVFTAIKKNDDMNIEIGSVKTYDADHCLVYSAFNAPVPRLITPRDFCYIKYRQLFPRYKTIDGKEHYVAMDLCYSVDSSFPDYVPVRKNRVRGELLMAGLVFERLSETQSRAYYIIHLDPKGWIPHWVVNLTAPHAGNNIRWVRDYLPNLENKKKKEKKKVKCQTVLE